jgi:DNA-binding HxlR family transcriptional regulator
MNQALAVLGQKYSTEILDAADEYRSVGSIQSELGIPPATCYRRVRALTEAGLLVRRHPADKSAAQYRRAVEGLEVRFEASTAVFTYERLPNDESDGTTPSGEVAQSD